jgi:tryptophan 2,3-dioxygenase
VHFVAEVWVSLILFILNNARKYLKSSEWGIVKSEEKKDCSRFYVKNNRYWIPACAGMTAVGDCHIPINRDSQ